MLDERETLRLIRAAKEGDSSAKEALLSANTPLLKSILRRYLNKGVEYEDLFELACMGLLKAISGFDESFGVRFSTYAVPMIAGEIKRFLRDDGSVKVSRALKKTARDINGYIEQYLQEHGTQPSVKEIADRFAIDESEVVFALGSSHMPVSIYEEAPHKDGNAQSIAERLTSPDTPEEMLDHMLLKQAIEKLPERERMIVVLRYFRDMTQSEVARLVGVSQVQISRIESKILSRFREELKS